MDYGDNDLLIVNSKWYFDYIYKLTLIINIINKISRWSED